MEKIEDVPLVPSTFETVDFALYDFINEKMNIHCSTNKGWKKVPVVWAGQERAKQSKDNPDLKDLQQSLVFPIISIGRGSPKKSNESKGKFYNNIPVNPDYKGGSIVISKRIKQDKTANFANAEAYRESKYGGVGQLNFPRRKNKTVYEIISIPQPVYYEIPYKIMAKTEYQSQMNEILQPFLFRPGAIHRVMLERDGYRYEAFIQQEYGEKNNLDDMSSESRKFECEIAIKVYGYLIGGTDNENKPFLTVRENIVDVKIPRETVMLGDFPEE
jgi:hypothetical protein